MLIDRMRIRWGVSNGEIVCTFSIGEAGARYTVPLAMNVSVRVAQMIDTLVDSGLISDSSRQIAIDTARAEFENWGYRW